MFRRVMLGLAMIALMGTPAALGQTRPEARNMALVGTHDLQARGAYQPLPHRQGNRWISRRSGPRLLKRVSGQHHQY